MNYKDYFVTYTDEIEEYLNQHFKNLVSQAQKIHPIVAEGWKKLEVFMTGGKRLRGALIKLGYQTAGGKNLSKILPISTAIEITHGSVLAHDDIIDQDEFRHGKPTLHTVYKRHHEKHYRKKSPLHYGESMAICIADAGLYEAMVLLTESKFEPEIRARLTNQLAHSMVNTAYGEALDVDYEYHERVPDSAVHKIHTLKTAFYTFIGPLKMGALAAGSKNGLARFELYGLPIGIAFQIVDDILGVFGDEKKSGKSAAYDIKEGKNTLLYTYAVKKARTKQKSRLQSLYGKRNITKKETEEVRQIFRDTGSLDYSRGQARKLADKAMAAIPKITKDKELQEVYKTLANYIVERES